MMQGVEIAENCSQAYKDMKRRDKYKYIIFKVTDDRSQVVIDELGGPEKTFDDFKAKFKQVLSAKDCRFAILQLDLESNGKKLKKESFFCWFPATATPRNRNVYSSTKHQVETEFRDIGLKFAWSQESDADYDAIVEEACRRY